MGYLFFWRVLKSTCQRCFRARCCASIRSEVRSYALLEDHPRFFSRMCWVFTGRHVYFLMNLQTTVPISKWVSRWNLIVRGFNCIVKALTSVKCHAVLSFVTYMYMYLKQKANHSTPVSRLTEVEECGQSGRENVYRWSSFTLAFPTELFENFISQPKTMYMYACSANVHVILSSLYAFGTHAWITALGA